MPGNPAHRTYVRRVFGFMAAYVVTLSIALRFVGSGAVAGLPAFLLALLPGLAVVGVFWAVARLLIDEQDEYLRLLLVRQSLVATGFALSIATIWGFLEAVDLVPHVDSYFIAILWFAGLGVGSLVNRLTLGAGWDEQR